MPNTIPHIIHYCWFGKSELPALEKACMKTWSKLKGYKFMRWDESTFNIKKANQFVMEAYRRKKYAFVSDYVRLYALYQFGGVYIDTDMEIYQDFSKIIDAHDVVGGFEHDTIASAGFIAAKPKCAIIKELLETYETKQFIKEDGSLNMTPINFGWNGVLKKYGMIPNGKTQVIDSDFGLSIFIGNWHHFNSVSMKTWHAEYTDETYTVHHYSGSWLKASGIKKTIGAMKNRLKLLVGFRNYAKIQKFTERFQRRR